MDGDQRGRDERERWLVVRVPVPARGEEHLLVDALHRVGARRVEREGERVAALYPWPSDRDALLAEVRAAVRASTSIVEPVITWRRPGAGEWWGRWVEAVAPRRLGNRIVVVPASVEAATVDADIAVRLVPGLAFGTGEHATTRTCLRLLERVAAPGQRVADVGAGSGILSIAAALLGAGRAVAYEVDAHACAAARRNVAVNRVGDRVDVRCVEATPATLRDAEGFDGVVANLHAAALAPLLPSIRDALKVGGWLIISGVLAHEWPGILRAAAEVGLHPAGDETEDGWRAVLLLSGRDPGRGTGDGCDSEEGMQRRAGARPSQKH